MIEPEKSSKNLQICRRASQLRELPTPGVLGVLTDPQLAMSG